MRPRPGRHGAGQRHEHLDEAEVHVGVEHDRDDVDGQEDDRGAAEEPVQVEQPRRPRPAAEHAGAEREAPQHAAARSAHVTMPAARAVYQRRVARGSGLIVARRSVRGLGGAWEDAGRHRVPGRLRIAFTGVSQVRRRCCVHGSNPAGSGHPSPRPAVTHRRSCRKRGRHRCDRRPFRARRNPDPGRVRDRPHDRHAVSIDGGAVIVGRLGDDCRTGINIRVHIGAHRRHTGDLGQHLERWQLSAASGRWARGRT